MRNLNSITTAAALTLATACGGTRNTTLPEETHGKVYELLTTEPEAATPTKDPTPSTGEISPKGPLFKDGEEIGTNAGPATLTQDFTPHAQRLSASALLRQCQIDQRGIREKLAYGVGGVHEVALLSRLISTGNLNREAIQEKLACIEKPTDRLPNGYQLGINDCREIATSPAPINDNYLSQLRYWQTDYPHILACAAQAEDNVGQFADCISRDTITWREFTHGQRSPMTFVQGDMDQDHNGERDDFQNAQEEQSNGGLGILRMGNPRDTRAADEQFEECVDTSTKIQAARKGLKRLVAALRAHLQGSRAEGNDDLEQLRRLQQIREQE